MLSNTIGAIVSVLVVKRLSGAAEVVAFTTRSGFVMLAGGLVQAVVCA